VTTATERLNRIVSLVAELSRDGGSTNGISFAELAVSFGTTESAIASDVRALTSLGESAADDWLLSLHLWQDGDRLAGTSIGPFRRPIRLTPEELLAIRVGLAADPQSAERLSPELRRVLVENGNDGDGDAPVTVAIDRARFDGNAICGLLLDAVHLGRCVDIRYLTPGDGEPHRRTVHPYRVLKDRGFVYLSAWCEAKEGWRRFRLDRILEAAMDGVKFQRRPEEEVLREAEAVFRKPDSKGVNEVKVRFAPGVARWLKERYPGGIGDDEGGLIVSYPVASPHWFLRHVLQYGDAAEVIEPEPYRVAVAAAVGLQQHQKGP